ncbi:type II DNA topoisomerase [Ramicandelaber brevisporus]|nr:type II DNA topoisomerase [Ramicandelaber brevisporus]
MDEFIGESGKAKPGNVKKKTIEEQYSKMDQREHMLTRPDMYIGSVEPNPLPMWVFEKGTRTFLNKTVTITEGLYKIVDEILVNAADHKQRDSSMTQLKVTIDKESGWISVWNNGTGIPVDVHKEHGVHVPEMLFGMMLTSSNYDDEEERTTGGRNGVGAKATNVFSSEFIVETAHKESKRKYVQKWTNNMSQRSDPKITNLSRAEGYAMFKFLPDYKRFGMDNGMDDDTEAVLMKRVYDMAGVVRGIKVYLNDELIPISTFKEYVTMYLMGEQSLFGSNKLDIPIIYEKANERWEIAFAPSSTGQFQQISFVNSICTTKGGMHVNHVVNLIAAPLIESMKKGKNKTAELKPAQVKNYMWVFVNSTIVNPKFDGQSKATLTSRESSFGMKCTISDKFAKDVGKSGIIEYINDWLESKKEKQLKKTDGTKSARLSGIAKLTDASDAGTARSKQCTLILTEGDSAKTLAIAGLGVVGREKWGVFPLRGKVLNVRESSADSITKNEEITALKRILGLKHGVTYNDTSQLRYGSVMIMTDQDPDGSHIKGLLLNLFAFSYPSLLQIPGFMCEMITPLFRATKGGQFRNFFTWPEYETWCNSNESKGWTVKYYKGLGSSTPKEAREYFTRMDDIHKKEFEKAKNEDYELLDLAFNKKRATDRKNWLTGYDPENYVDHTGKSVPIDDFVNIELMAFSHYDNVRAIPSIIDGLKPTQRKVLYGAFLRKLKARPSIKVPQLSGFVSEKTAYHHGEMSMHQTIINMAADYVGNSNIPLLIPDGQFGSRLEGGKDSASARYLSTALPPITRALYPKADDDLLESQIEDNELIEPKFFVPVVPMVLINGSSGIGTGWSSSIPNYNPSDIVSNIKKLMNNQPMDPIHPWYRGFIGQIESTAPSSYRTVGIIEKIDDNTVEITELPVGTWTQSYKEQLEKWTTGSDKEPAWIESYTEMHTEATVHFRVILVILSDDQMSKAENEGLVKKFKLSSTLSTNNLVGFDQTGHIRKYESPLDILQEFYTVRSRHYLMRKQSMLDSIELDYRRLTNKAKFVTEIIQRKLTVQNKPKSELVKELHSRGYDQIGKNADTSARAKAEAHDDDDDAETKSNVTPTASGYDYLLSMPIWNLTKEKVERLIRERDSKQQELDVLKNTTPMELWNRDLDEFVKLWEAKLDDDAEQIRLQRLELAAGSKGKSAAKGRRAPAKKATTAVKKEAAATTAVKKEAASAAAKKRKATMDDFIATPPARKKTATQARKASTGAADDNEGPVPTMPATKSETVTLDDDSDGEDDFEITVPAKATASKPAAKTAAAKTAAASAAATTTTTTAAAKKAAPARGGRGKKAALDDSESDDYMGGDSDSDSDGIGSGTRDSAVVVAAPRPARASRATASKPSYREILIDSDDDDEE